MGSITQPLPSSYLIFRAASESDGEHALFFMQIILFGGPVGYTDVYVFSCIE